MSNGLDPDPSDSSDVAREEVSLPRQSQAHPGLIKSSGPLSSLSNLSQLYGLFLFTPLMP